MLITQSRLGKKYSGSYDKLTQKEMTLNVLLFKQLFIDNWF